MSGPDDSDPWVGDLRAYNDEPVTVTMPRYWWLIVSTCVRLVYRTDGLRSERALLPVIDEAVSEQSGYGETETAA